MRILKVIESKRWRHIRSGTTASIYGAVPWTFPEGRHEWVLETVGFTWMLDNGTVGLGRVPAKTFEEAQAVMEQFNAKFAR